MNDVKATAWSRAEDGLPLMPIFRDFDFDWVEAPLPLDDLEGHAKFQGFGVPIGGGDIGLTTRFEYAQMFAVGRIDIAQPDVTMVGGLTELVRVSDMARELGKRVVGPVRVDGQQHQQERTLRGVDPPDRAPRHLV